MKIISGMKISFKWLMRARPLRRRDMSSRRYRSVPKAALKF